MKVQSKSESSVNAGSERPRWHSLTQLETLTAHRSHLEGLTTAEAALRKDQFGPNQLPRPSGDGWAILLWRQINNPLIWVLIGSGGVAVGMGKAKDGIVVLAVVLLNTVIGFLQEFRASKAIESLSAMVPEFATVLRDGQKATVPVSEVVPGDVVVLASGDRVPADLRLVSLRNLQIEEAALTGESVPVQKQLEPVDPKSGIGDRTNLAFGGTMVTYGTGTGIVVETGASTELGRISKMLNEATDLQTPLTKALAAVGKILTVAILIVSGLLLAISLGRGYSLTDALLMAITLAVAAIPEGLPAIVTIALAIGVQRMASRRAVIRKLPAVETLGSTTVICTDKTGTLTRNEMTVRALWVPGGSRHEVSGIGYEPKGDFSPSLTDGARELLEAAALCNDAALHQEGGKWHLVGDPTEGALVVATEKAGIPVETLRDSNPRLDAIPFESENGYMATLHESRRHQRRVLIKGAPEVVAQRCAGANLPEIHAQVEALASQGMRVLAVAEGDAQGRGLLEEAHIHSGLRLLGLLGMIDPPRPEAIDAVQACHQAGITVKMITGDHKLTAKAIGEQLGLGGGEAVGGTTLAELSDSDLRQVAKRTNIFARVAPEHKLRLVRALQEEGNIVAMTGDGVNDAPALKQSNIGVAMGITGTAASKEAADMVLTDDNFASIAAAVEEGRRVYDNLVKSLAFVLPTNLGLALILMLAVMFFPIQNIAGKPVPLMPMLPTQLLWINLVATVALALPLAFEAKEPSVMRRPPRSPEEPILSPFVVIRTVVVAVLMSLGALGLFWWEYSREASLVGHETALREAQTMAVTTVIFFQNFYLVHCRSLRDPIPSLGVFSNPAVYVGIGTLIGLQLALMYVPWMQSLFGTSPLGPEALASSVAVGAIILPVISFEKWWRNRGSSSVA